MVAISLSISFMVEIVDSNFKYHTENNILHMLGTMCACWMLWERWESWRRRSKQRKFQYDEGSCLISGKEDVHVLDNFPFCVFQQIPGNGFFYFPNEENPLFLTGVPPLVLKMNQGCIAHKGRCSPVLA